MPKIAKRPQIQVQDNGVKDGKRHFRIELDLPEDSIRLADFLVTQQVIEPFTELLKARCEAAITDHTEQARSLLSTLRTQANTKEAADAK